MQFSGEVLAIKQEIDHLFVKSPNSQAVLDLLGGFIQKKRYAPPNYSWEEHRKWVIENANPIKIGGEFHREVSTNAEHQVYVVNTTYQPTEMSEKPYVGQLLLPLGDKGKKIEFRCGFICAGWINNGSYQTQNRPEDFDENGKLALYRHEKDSETFSAKLYFLDKNRPRDVNYYFSGTQLIVTARVRLGVVISLCVQVRTNAQRHRDGSNYDKTIRAYEKDFGDWKVAKPFSYEGFYSLGPTQEEMRYHNKMHSLVYELITKEGA